MAANGAKKWSWSGCSPALVEVLRVLGAAYRERQECCNESTPGPPSNPDGSESPEEAAWTKMRQVEQDALTWHPLLWLCERIVNLTGVDDDIDFNEVKEEALDVSQKYASGWHLFKSQPTGMPDRRVPREITRELRALDRDGLSGPMIQEMVREYRDHPDITQLLDRFPQLKAQAKRAGSGRKRVKRTEPKPLTKKQQKALDLKREGKTVERIGAHFRTTKQAASRLLQRAEKREAELDTVARSVGRRKLRQILDSDQPA